jgi:uncharacterized protein YndB with AHSA1/START domain
MAEAELARFIDRYTMEFIRTYPHPVERVWRAIVEPGEIGQWFIAPTTWELQVGGAYRFHDDAFSGTVLEVDPPRLIRFGGPSEHGPNAWFQFELEPVDDGTRLRFVQRSTPGIAYPWQPPHAWDAPWGGGNLGGWHSAFEELADLLDGVPCGSRRPPTEFSAIVQDWAERFGRELTAAQRDKVARELRERERWFELIKIYRAHVDATLPPAKPREG